VLAAEMITVTKKDGRQIEGITTKLLEHGVDVYMDELDVLYLGEPIQLSILKSKYDLRVNGTVVSVHNSCNSDIPSVYTVEILDFNGQKDEYVQMLYDRKPTLPQRLRLGEGLFYSLWNNFARRIVIK
jgi:cellulose synthase (UDP-forming)